MTEMENVLLPIVIYILIITEHNHGNQPFCMKHRLLVSGIHSYHPFYELFPFLATVHSFSFKRVVAHFVAQYGR